jgi:hypothetical protein
MLTSDLLALAGLIVVVGISTIGLCMRILENIAKLNQKVDGALSPDIEALKRDNAEHFRAENSLDKRVTVIETQHQRSLA